MDLHPQALKRSQVDLKPTELTLTPASKTVGVIGGLGPLATIQFMQRLYGGRSVGSEQEFVRAIVDCNPQIPSRDAMSEGERQTVGSLLAEMAGKLYEAGAGLIVMPCNTAHIFEDQIRATVPCPFLSIIDVAVHAAFEGSTGSSKIGLLATDACLDAQLYQRKIHQHGGQPITLGVADQQLFMQLVAAIKLGDTSRPVSCAMGKLADRLFDDGADVVIAACTEIPLVTAQADVDGRVINSLTVLADRTWALAQGSDR